MGSALGWGVNPASAIVSGIEDHNGEELRLEPYIAVSARGRHYVVAFAAAAILALGLFVWQARGGTMPSLDFRLHNSSKLYHIRMASAVPDIEPVAYVDVSADRAREINESAPFSKEPLTAARPFIFTGTAEERERALDCLAAAQFYEAGNDPVGQASVAQVVLNRARHPSFPKSVCGTVFQGSERVTGCQFSFTCDGAMVRRRPTPTMWADARSLAAKMLAGQVDKSVGLATHYHTDWVLPVWSPLLSKLAKVGTHLFFRWPGAAGSPGAFVSRLGGAEPAIVKMVALSPVHRAGLTPDMAALLQEDGTMVVDGSASILNAAPGQLVDVADSKPDIRGNKVLRTDTDEKTFLIALAPDAFPGTYAMTALSLCRNKGVCHVVGWRDPAALPKSVAMLNSAVRRASFVYEKDVSRSIDRARWDCTQVQRPDPTQCL